MNISEKFYRFAAARVIPDVCDVFMSSSPACTILTPNTGLLRAAIPRD
jgi:hypothetical protein